MASLINKVKNLGHHNQQQGANPTTTSAQPGMHSTNTVGNTYNPGQTYSGLNLPYNGAQNHPQYGYQRLTPVQKAERFELKAQEWERKGNQQKAQKNREKAQRYRLRTQPGYVAQQRPQTYYVDRANLYNQKALQYQQWGMQSQYQRYNGRAQRIRTKHGLPAYNAATMVNQPIVHQTTHVVAPIVQETVRQDRVIEVQPVVHREVDKNVVHHIEKHYTERAPSQSGTVELAAVVQQQINTNVVNEIQPIIHRERVVPVVERTEQHTTQHVVAPTIHTHEVVYESGPYVGQQTMGMQQNILTKQYSGLNFGYSNYGAAAHPQYGYQRIPHNKKAERFEAKALQWEQKGNMVKAQKNREKAQRYRARSQPGYVAQQRPQTYYVDRANLFDQKALQYQQWGMQPQYQRYQGRAQRIRTKRGLPAYQQQGAPLYSNQQQQQQQFAQTR